MNEKSDKPPALYDTQIIMDNLEKALKFHDRDGNGTVDNQEFSVGANKKVSFNLRSGDRIGLFKVNLETDENGSLSISDALKEAEEQAKQEISKYDKDNDGVARANEVTATKQDATNAIERSIQSYTTVLLGGDGARRFNVTKSGEKSYQGSPSVNDGTIPSTPENLQKLADIRAVYEQMLCTLYSLSTQKPELTWADVTEITKPAQEVIQKRSDEIKQSAGNSK